MFANIQINLNTRHKIQMGATKVTPIYYNSTDFQHFTY